MHTHLIASYSYAFEAARLCLCTLQEFQFRRNNKHSASFLSLASIQSCNSHFVWTLSKKKRTITQFIMLPGYLLSKRHNPFLFIQWWTEWKMTANISIAFENQPNFNLIDTYRYTFTTHMGISVLTLTPPSEKRLSVLYLLGNAWIRWQ